MTAGPLPRLRRRLIAYVAVVTALAIAVPATVLRDTVASRDRERVDNRVAGAARDVKAVLLEDTSQPGSIDVSTYTSIPRAQGAPVTAVLDRHGAMLAGDREPPSAVVRAARERAQSGNDGLLDVATPAGDVRMISVGVEGEKRTLGAAVAYVPLGPLRHDIRSATLLIALLGIGGWVLAVAGAALLVVRGLRPSTRAAAREQAFLADAAHELRTPWAIVRGRAEQALRDGAQEEDLRVIARTAREAGASIGDMLELARLDAGRALWESEPIALDALVETCLQDRVDAARTAGVRVFQHGPGNLVVRGDEQLLARAVGNLVDNALRHGAAGGRLDVTLARDDGSVAVTVADQGPGVPPGQRERVFDRFHRGSAAAAGGSGLGLPIARLVAEAHGGTLVLGPDDHSGPGARFVMRLPAA